MLSLRRRATVAVVATAGLVAAGGTEASVQANVVATGYGR